MEILQKIPFEVENKTIVSEKVFNWMIEDAGYENQDKVLTYYLDTESAAWNQWNKKLLFTDLNVEIPLAPEEAAAANATIAKAHTKNRSSSERRGGGKRRRQTKKKLRSHSPTIHGNV